MVAVAENGVIGSGPDIPWQVKGEQLLFKAMTFNQWLIVGRKTYESMGQLPNRKYAVISRRSDASNGDDVLLFPSTDKAIKKLSSFCDHAIVSGGGEIYQALLPQVETIHLSRVHATFEGNVCFPEIPPTFNKVFEQSFQSNINYTYQIWRKH